MGGKRKPWQRVAKEAPPAPEPVVREAKELASDPEPTLREPKPVEDFDPPVIRTPKPYHTKFDHPVIRRGRSPGESLPVQVIRKPAHLSRSVRTRDRFGNPIPPPPAS